MDTNNETSKEENVTSEAKNQPSGSSNKSMMMVLVAIAVIVFVIGGFFVARKIKRSMTSTDTTSSNNSATAVQPASSTSSAISVHGGSFYFKPNEIHVKKGDKVNILFTNDGGAHDFAIDEFNVKSNVINDGASTTVSFVADKAGTFEYYCSVGTHRQMGMKGKLVVE